MNISSITSFASSVASTQALQSDPSIQGSSNDSSTGQIPTHHHHHGGGRMEKELASALDSIGLAVPDSSTSGTDSNATIKTDMKQFMQALGQAVQAQSSSSASSGTAASDPQAGFGAGLSAVISQVASGNAPAGLQSAFAKLASDLAASSSTSSTATATTTAGGGNTQASLQALLTRMQQDMGDAGHEFSAGNLVNTQV